MSEVANGSGWWARGLLFENCSCQLVCPGHVHFSQLCTKEPCVGYWAVRIDAGEHGGIDLAGTRALVVFECPQMMIDGDWIEALIIDAGASEPQRQALEAIFSGKSGGPWELLDRFVAERHVRFLPIRFDEDGRTKRASIEGVLEATIKQIKGRDRDRPVSFENMFNQIHAPEQILARGDTAYDDGVISFRNEGSHGLYSRFEWKVEC